MKTRFLPLLLASGISAAFSLGASAADRHDVLVGSYTGGTSQGIYRLQFDSDSGQLDEQAQQVVASANPSWLTLSQDQTHLYAVNENGPGATDPIGRVSAFSIAPSSHTISPLNQVESRGDEPTYSSLAGDGRHLFVANYAVQPTPGGSLAVLGVQPNGQLSEVIQQLAHEPSGVNRERQLGSHVHSVVSSPDGHFVYAQDLGADKVFIYRYQPGNPSKPLQAASPASVQLPAGSGPRHLIFSADGQHAYLTLEMSGQVAVFDVRDGQLLRKQMVDLAAGGDTAHKAAAALHFSADGRFLYVTNRGQASELLTFAVDPASGTLRELQRRAVEGIEPREFSLDPSGRFVLIANQKSNEIVVIRRTPEDGLLHDTVQHYPMGAPSDLKFLR